MLKVNAAADYLAESGESGLAAFNDSKGSWVFRDTYVFVFDCVKKTIAAHVDPKFIGFNLNDLVDRLGNYLGLKLCTVANNPHGGWAEYWWPRIGSDEPQRKISYMRKVPGQVYAVGAGIYDPKWSVQEVNRLIPNMTGPDS